MATLSENVTEFENEFGFPTEFPYEFDSFETENSDEEEDFFAGLTRRMSHASIHETRKKLTVPIFNNEKTEEKVTIFQYFSP